MIEVSNITKIYPNQRGVKNINFTVAKGELLGLLGPNGAGKTTIMRMVTGYLYPTRGTIKVGGCDLFDDPLGVRKQIGYLPEIPPIYPEMSVLDYLKFAARLKGVKKRELNAETNRVMELTGLEQVRRQLIGSLSKGFRQRVGLAQALLNSPPVLILDEPTVGLDPKQIIEIRNLISNLAHEHTVILSSHILPEVNLICNRVVIIDQGQLVAIDTPDGLARQLREGQKVEITVKGSRPEIEPVLKNVKEIREWSFLETLPDNTCRFLVQSETEGNLQELLFKTFAKADLPLLEMRTVNLSLEEIFLQLTTEEDDPNNPGNKPSVSGPGKEDAANG
ncbi:MAG: ABC transporter ATP-binding protein [Firmicutes bacterium]|nr:ABC transporter ATP-binding protein [Bacillota bacterium]